MPRGRGANSEAKDWILEKAKAPDGLGLLELNFIAAIETFYKQMEPYRVLLADLKTFQPVIAYINEIEASLEEGIGWLQDYVNGSLRPSKLAGYFKEEVAEGLDSVLSGGLNFRRRVLADLPPAVEQVLEDLDDLVESYGDDIRRKGYDMFHVLIGAA